MLRILAALGVSLGVAFGNPPAPQLNKDYGRRPLAFEENRGQADRHARFIARGDGYSVFITGEKAILSLTRGKTISTVSMQVAGAKAHASPQAEDRLQSYSNYFIGNDPSKWIQGVPHFGRIKLAGVKKGVDLVYYGNQSQLEYDLEIAPNANTSDLRLRFDGAQSLRVDRDGDLLIHTAAGDVREHAPVAWQEVAGERLPVEVWHVVRGRGEVAFGIGKHNPSLPLIIDPIITYSTYLGGSSTDTPTAIAADSSGYAYVTGYTTSADFPVTSGFYHGTTDAFITKLNPSGSALIYSTYIGGSSTDNAAAIALDSSGNAYITGLTYSSDFPIIFSGGSSYVASPDAFVAKVDSSGVLTASRYLVGANSSGTGIAVDAANNPYVVGTTASAAFPTTAGSFLPAKPAGSSSTGFVAKLDGSLNVSYGTYLGGTNNDAPKAIAIGSNGEAYITGMANSANFPTTNGAYQTTFKGSGDTFVAELNSQGSGLIYSTLLGGTSGDNATKIALDGAGNAYVAGSTQSTDFPITNGAFLTSKPSVYYVYSAFVTKVNAGGASLGYSTYLGGSNQDSALGIIVDTAGRAYVLGNTSSINFPTTPGALRTQPTPFYCCYSDVFLSELNPAGDSVIYSTYLGTASTESASGIAADGNGGIYVAGTTQSLVYPTTASAFQRTSKESGSTYTGFITKIDFSSPAVCNIVLSSNSASFPGRGGSGSFTFTVNGGCPWEITNDSFITVTSAHSGFGDGTVNYTVAQNQSTYSTQAGSVLVNGGTLTAGTNIFAVNQAAGSCTDPVFSASTVNFDQSGGITNVSVSLPGGCAWSLTNPAPWLTPSNSVNSAGTGTLSLYAPPNSYSPRQATITLATKTISVTQTGGSCTLSLNQSQTSVPAQASVGSVGFTTGGACTWGAYSFVPWIQVYGNPASGQGSASVSYIVAGNPGTAARVGSLLIGDQVYQITQAAGPGYNPITYTQSLYTLGYCCPPSGDGGPVTSASVYDPSQMVFDSSGNLFIADDGNGRIRKVDTNRIITTFAGGGTSGLGDGGSPTNAMLSGPRGVAIDPSGNVYISEANGNRIRKVSNNVISTIVGTGTAGFSGDNQAAAGAQINGPDGIVLDNSGNVYFSDTYNHRIRKVTPGGVISTVAGTGVAGFSGDGGNAIAAQLNYPGALSIDSVGNLYFIDMQNSRVRRISNAGIITTVAGNGSTSSSTGDGDLATSAGLFFAGRNGLTVDSAGSIYIGEWDGGIRKVTPDGIIRSISTYLNGYSVGGLGTDKAGNVYAGAHIAIYKFTPVPAFCTYNISPPGLQSAASGSFSLPITATTSACSWSASSSVSWITTVSANGTGTGTVQFTVAANPGTAARSGILTIAGKGLIVTQAGVPSAPASAVGASPASGSGAVQTFTASYSAANGYHDLKFVQMLIAVAANGGGQSYCFVHYDVQGNNLWLYGDGGFFLGPVTPGIPSNALQNSLCALNTSGSSVSGNGLTLTMNANLVFKSPGARNIYLRAENLAGIDTGWVQQGTWTAVAASLGTMTVSPSSGSVANGTQQTFTLTYPDTPGFAGAAFGWEQFLVAVASDGGGQPFCYVHYDRGGNGLWMYSSDVGYFLGPVTPGTASNVLTSSACSINTAGATVQNTGGNLVLTVPVTLKGPMVGSQKLFERALTVLNVDTGLVQTGTLTVN